jgi:uncharacterized RDD family membrane protein YckC
MNRFLGALLDGLVGITAVIALYVLTPFAEVVEASKHHNGISLYLNTGFGGYVALTLIAAITVMQATLVTIRGQSIGKIALGTQIQLYGGGAPGFVRGWLIRHGIVQIGSIVLSEWLGLSGTWIVIVYSLVDPLLVFRSDRRCLHDLIAGTEVVQIR